MQRKEFMSFRGIRAQLVILLAILVSAGLLLTGCFDDDDAVVGADSKPTPGYTITTTGGTGGQDNAWGGSGGYVDLYKEGGEKDVLLLKEGKTKPKFPTIKRNIYLGANPLNVTADTTVAVETVEPAAGTPYMVDNIYYIFISDGDGTIGDATAEKEERASGISVAEGATLTLGLNSNVNTEAQFNLTNDIDNQGTITTEDVDATQRGDLEVDCWSYQGSSSIDTSGTQDGQSGGDIDLSAHGAFFNDGTITSAGADSTTGAAGNGGDIYIQGEYAFENTASITSSGGTASGSGTSGGSAGDIDMYGDYGHMSNSGALTAMGGNGVTSGGSGNDVELYVDENGDWNNTGDINTSGGDGAGGSGGSAGDVELFAYGSDMAQNSTITAVGGSTTDAAFSAGSGGDLDVDSYYGYLYEYLPAGDIDISGDIDLSGGNAVATGTGNGGSGGDMYLYVEAEYYPNGNKGFDQRLRVQGYDSVDTSGADGNYGGQAGGVYLYSDYGDDENDTYQAGGSVKNTVDITARGGNVVAAATTTPANGGSGGWVCVETDYYYGNHYPKGEKAVNKGDIDATGGNSLESTTQGNGSGGGLWVWGYNGAKNSGSVTADGGSDPGTDGGTTGYGNYGGWLEVYANNGPAKNSGDLTGNGGDGEYEGGDAGGLDMWAPKSKNSGDATMNGGNALATLAGSTGGDGGYFELYSPEGQSGAKNSGTIVNAGGTGETEGDPGPVIVGGQCISGPCY